MAIAQRAKILERAELLFHEGTTALKEGYLEIAETKLSECLSLIPDRQSTRSNLATVHALQADLQADEGNVPNAIALYDQALQLYPNNVVVLSNKGVLLSDSLNLIEDAINCFSRVLELAPEFIDAHLNLGVCWSKKRNHLLAIRHYDFALSLDPNLARAWSNRGVALNTIGYPERALASCEKAIELKPGYAEAWSNRGNALNDLERHEEALASYGRSIELKPDADHVLGDLVGTQMKICDWTYLDERLQTLEKRLLSSGEVIVPFYALGLFDDPALHRQAAQIHAKAKLIATNPLGEIPSRSRREKIRIGYFSMDFRHHPVSHLIAELIEVHDRSRFEIYGFSFGVNTNDPMRKRLESAFDRFLEVKNFGDLDITRLARNLEVDIAIDLGGYTKDSRPAIFANRVAPIQINYLGFPGTMGSQFVDYLIADSVLIPERLQNVYSEKIVYLPNSFQVNDSKRTISNRIFTRQELGLPESGFVFCCFNNAWKILPDLFGTWIRILQSTPGSVLWLYENHPKAAENLQTQAAKRNVSPDRLVFARKMPHAEHLARYRLADLFLDTFPYGAHTTASDALWVGLPVLNRSGESFASRVAASLLHATGLPELITHTVVEYESLAIELAKSPERISALKTKLSENRSTCPLFNTPLFSKHIEAAYQATYDRHHAALAPDHIYLHS